MNPSKQEQREVDELARNASLGTAIQRTAARRKLLAAASRQGIWLASPQPIYASRAKVVPERPWSLAAINVRGMGYRVCRSIFRAAIDQQVGAFCLEVARSEMTYGKQRPDDLAAAALAAALREGYRGPIFLQGDHYRVDREKPLSAELKVLSKLISDSLRAGFRSIDIDASTLVDLEQTTVPQQQMRNADVTGRLVRFIRRRSREVSIGGEIGEIGKQLSTVDDLRTFLDLLRRRVGAGMPGIAKVAVQTGSSHGGTVEPDGTIKQTTIDLELLRRLSQTARQEYGLAGAVQHGASTLSWKQLAAIPATGCVEVHLSTQLQNLVFDHPAFPADFRRDIRRLVLTTFGPKRQAGQSDAQVVYRQRKFAWGEFRRRFWTFDRDAEEAIGRTLEIHCRQVFDALGVSGTRSTVNRLIGAAR